VDEKKGPTASCVWPHFIVNLYGLRPAAIATCRRKPTKKLGAIADNDLTTPYPSKLCMEILCATFTL